MNKTVEKVTDKVQKTVEECITATGESLDAMVERALKPRNFEVKAKVTRVETEPGAPRGPPKSALAGLIRRNLLRITASRRKNLPFLCRISFGLPRSLQNC